MFPPGEKKGDEEKKGGTRDPVSYFKMLCPLLGFKTSWSITKLAVPEWLIIDGSVGLIGDSLYYQSPVDRCCYTYHINTGK